MDQVAVVRISGLDTQQSRLLGAGVTDQLIVGHVMKQVQPAGRITSDVVVAVGARGASR